MQSPQVETSTRASCFCWTTAAKGRAQFARGTFWRWRSNQQKSFCCRS